MTWLLHNLTVLGFFIHCSCVVIHRMTPPQDDLSVCLNTRYTKSAADTVKPRVQIKALLYRPPGRRPEFSSKRSSHASAGVDMQKKIIVIIKFTNRGKTSLEEEYIVVDHVTDQKTKASYRLLNPLVFKAKQHQIKQMYPLRAIRSVNWDPWEEVINKNNKMYKGCSTDVTQATCGVQYDSRQRLVEYSEGFCCSCDAYVNMNRQPADFSPEYIHLPLDPEERFKRNVDSKDSADLSTTSGQSRRESVLNEEDQEELKSRIKSLWTRRTILDLKSCNKMRDSNFTQVRRKKEIGKLFTKAHKAFESIKSKTMEKFSNLNNLFDGTHKPETKIADSPKRYHLFPNYITIPGFETAYGFTSNDTRRLNAVVDPWDSSLNRGTSNSQDDERNRLFFHALGELQSGRLNISLDLTPRENLSGSTDNNLTSETQTNRHNMVGIKSRQLNTTKNLITWRNFIGPSESILSSSDITTTKQNALEGLQSYLPITKLELCTLKDLNNSIEFTPKTSDETICKSYALEELPSDQLNTTKQPYTGVTTSGATMNFPCLGTQSQQLISGTSGLQSLQNDGFKNTSEYSLEVLRNASDKVSSEETNFIQSITNMYSLHSDEFLSTSQESTCKVSNIAKITANKNLQSGFVNGTGNTSIFSIDPNEKYDILHYMENLQNDPSNSACESANQNISSLYYNVSNVLKKSCFKRSVTDSCSTINLKCENKKGATPFAEYHSISPSYFTDLLPSVDSSSFVNNYSNTYRPTLFAKSYSISFENPDTINKSLIISSSSELDTSLIDHRLSNSVNNSSSDIFIPKTSRIVRILDPNLINTDEKSDIKVSSKSKQSSTVENQTTISITIKKTNVVVSPSKEEKVSTSLQKEEVTLESITNNSDPVNTDNQANTEETIGIMANNVKEITDNSTKDDTETNNPKIQVTITQKPRTSTSENYKTNKLDIIDIVISENVNKPSDIVSLDIVGNSTQNLTLISKEKNPNIADPIIIQNGSKQYGPIFTVNKTLIKFENMSDNNQNNIVLKKASNQTVYSKVTPGRIVFRTAITTILYPTTNQIANRSGDVSNNILQHSSPSTQSVKMKKANSTHATDKRDKWNSGPSSTDRNSDYNGTTSDSDHDSNQRNVSTETFIITWKDSIDTEVSTDNTVMAPATNAIFLIQKAGETNGNVSLLSSTESQVVISNYSQSTSMYEIYQISNISQLKPGFNKIYEESTVHQVLNDSSVNKKSKFHKLRFQIRNRIKEKMKMNASVIANANLYGKIKVQNILNKMRHSTLLKSKNNSILDKYSNFLKNIDNERQKKHGRKWNHDKVQSLENDGETENSETKQYSCQHLWADTVPVENFLLEVNNKGVPDNTANDKDNILATNTETFWRESNGLNNNEAPLNKGKHKVPWNNFNTENFIREYGAPSQNINDPDRPNLVKNDLLLETLRNDEKVSLSIKDNNVNRNRGEFKTSDQQRKINDSEIPTTLPSLSNVTAHTENDMEFSKYDKHESRFKEYDLQLKPDLINTLLNFVQDESLIQMYNERKLYANRSLLKREVEKFVEDIMRNLMKHEARCNSTSRDDVRKIIKRQITSSGVQVRGGQSCVDRIVPSYVSDPDSYHESAHCLRYSDIWYTLYKLGGSFIEHSVDVQIYEKHYVHKYVNHWSQLSKGMPTRIRSSSRHLNNRNSKCPKCPSISINYLPLENNKKGPFSLNPDALYLLAPQHNCRHCESIQGGPGEYLLVPPDDVTLEGDECNKMGVGYRAFASQPGRCSHPKGTCLNKQISDLWHLDKKAKRANRRGKYFLENFASVSNDSHTVNSTTGEEYLALEYLRGYSSAVEIEIDNHFHTVVKVGESASISEVHIDATCKLHTKLGVLVTNHGLTSGLFRVNLTDCPLEIDPQCSQIDTSPVTIYPQQRHVFRLSLNGDLPLDRFSLSVLVTDVKLRRVATRKAHVQKLDRCFCIHHCECACTGSASGLQCSPLSVQEYHEAGFIGSLPVDSDPRGDDYRNLFNTVFSATKSSPWISVFVHLSVVSLLMGVAKAIVGLCCLDYVGTYGVWMLVPKEAKNLREYKEPELQEERVVYDETGYPVHPTYCTRSILYVSQCKQFFLNILFYDLLLLVVIKNIFLHHLFVLCNFLGCCCCQSWIREKQHARDCDRMRGGGEEEYDEEEEAEEYIRHAHKEVLEKFYSGREEDDFPTSCGPVHSDGALDMHSYLMSAGLQHDVLSEPSRKTES